MIRMKKICMLWMLLSSTACTVTANMDSNTGVIPSTVDGSYTIGPNYTADPAVEPCSGNDCERGETFNLFMPTKDSAYYNCDMDANPSLSANCSRSCFEDAVNPGYREVTVYVPAAYNDGDETGIMVMQDGGIGRMDGGIPKLLFKNISNVMDNFIGSEDDNRSLPTFVLIAVQVAGIGVTRGFLMGNPCGDGPGSERNNEYATVSDKYAEFISYEVLPFVINHEDVKSKYPNLKLTEDAAGRAAYGTSKGGATAFEMAFFRPDLFGISIGYSMYLNSPGLPNSPGTNANLTSEEKYPLGLAEFWTDPPEGQALIMAKPKKTIRVFHNANENDFNFGKYRDVLEANNKTAVALTAMGYDTRYAYGLNAVHIDNRVILQDTPNTLVWAWDDWKKKQQNSLNPFTFGRPDDATLINNLAFPNWCLKGGIGSDAEERVSCNDAAKGEANGQINPKLFTPIYLSFKNSGGAPELGGYPTNTDIQYVYEFAAPFLGQAGGGTSDQCTEDFDGQRESVKKGCGKLNTLNDDGPYGPGHVPPHIAVAAIKFALAGEGNGVSAIDGPAVPDESWFDFPTTGCRIKTSILFDCLRTFYPRTPGEVVKYPPPFTAEGGDYKLEFVNKVGESCAAEQKKFPSTICFEEHSGGGPEDYPDYIKQGGGPHYCSKIAVEADVSDGWCPYLFFGPNRGQYRHPHIAYAALSQYIAHLVMPEKCGTAWDDSAFPAAVDTTVAWPVETEISVKSNNNADFDNNVLPSPPQPKTIRRQVGKSSKARKGKLTFVWPDDNGFKKKPVIGQFANSVYVVE